MRPTGDPAPSDPVGKGSSVAPRLLLAVGSLLFAACAGSVATSPTPGGAGLSPSPVASATAGVTVTPSTTPAASPSATGLNLVDDEGTAITLDGPPRTVVSLTPATTELLFALGVGDRLAGRTQSDDFPPEATALPVVATFSGVLIEKVVDLAPGLVLAGGNNFTPPDDVARLRELGIPVLVLYAPDVDGVLADIRLVGRAVGAEEEAESVVAGIEQRIDEVSAAVAALERPRVFYEIGNQPEIYGPAPQSFVADMVSLAGGEPITTTDPHVFSISLERLVDLDPQVIVLGDAAYGVCPSSVAIRSGWTALTAVREGNVRPVDDLVVTRPGPRLGEGLAALALAIHPDAPVEPPAGAAEYCPGL